MIGSRGARTCAIGRSEDYHSSVSGTMRKHPHVCQIQWCRSNQIKANQMLFPKLCVTIQNDWYSQIFRHNSVDSPNADCRSWAYQLINRELHRSHAETHRCSVEKEWWYALNWSIVVITRCNDYIHVHDSSVLYNPMIIVQEIHREHRLYFF